MGDIIGTHGGYAGLKAFQTTEIIYDATVVFCNRFLDRRSRTNDQMIQAARSGRQNIAEGSQASGTSNKTELKLVSVARASLEELLLDYRDFLRQHQLTLWGKNDPRALEIRRMVYRSDWSYRTYQSLFEKGSSETAANAAICLIHQASFLLDRLLARLEEDFLQQGGFTERLYTARTNYRKRKN